MTPCEFTHTELLRLYVSAPAALWRHDVDVSLEAAATMAAFGHMAGVSCTFCVMPRNRFYNLFCEHSHQLLEQIVAGGHRLAIHCDYRGHDSVYRVVQRDRELVNTAYPDMFDLHFIAFHMPPAAVLWRDFDGFENAHGSKWEGRYVSDSRREWTPEKAASITDDMQVALHPEHWFLR